MVGDTNKDIAETIRVFVRPKPNHNSTSLLNQEWENTKQNGILSFADSQKSCTYYSGATRNTKSFYAHHFFSMQCEQQEVFDETAMPILDSVLKGYSGSILAYGATGSGKTYTMRGDDTVEYKGVIPRSIEYLLATKASSMEVWASYVQIYCEVLTDLLPADAANVLNFSAADMNQLSLREKADTGSVYIEGVSRYKVETVTDMASLLSRGDQNRAQATTNFNETSSRSHAILMLTVLIPEDKQGGAYREGKLMLVDLAGSERVFAASANQSHKRAEEGIAINLSISALGNVLQALAEKRKYIPYRDSKLTRLLQGHIGSSARTAIIVNICDLIGSSSKQTPILYNDLQGEILNSLRFAERAMKVEVRAVQSRIVTDYELLYKQTLEKLQTLETKPLIEQETKYVQESKHLEERVSQQSEEISMLKQQIALLQQENKLLLTQGSSRSALPSVIHGNNFGKISHDNTAAPSNILDLLNGGEGTLQAMQSQLHTLINSHQQEMHRLNIQKTREAQRLNDQMFTLQAELAEAKRILHSEREQRLQEMQEHRNLLERNYQQENYYKTRLTDLLAENEKLISSQEDYKGQLEELQSEVVRIEKEKAQMIGKAQVEEMQGLFMDTIERLTNRVQNLEKQSTSPGGDKDRRGEGNGRSSLYSEAYQTLAGNQTYSQGKAPLPPVPQKETFSNREVRLEPGRIRPSSNNSTGSVKSNGSGGSGTIYHSSSARQI